MKKYRNIFVKIAICVLIVSNLTSCRGAREINKLAIVIGMGIDISEEPDKVQMTAQIANVIGIKGTQKDSGGSREGYFNLKESGKSISEIISAYNRKLSRKMFFSHNQVIVFGENAAEEGLEKYLDFLMRYKETRPLVWVLISKGPASEILELKPSLESTPGRNIAELIKGEKETTEVPAVDLRDFASKLMSKTTSPIAPMIEVSETGGSHIAYLSETAVFKKDKMVGKLNKKETRGLLWGTNKVKDGVIVIGTSDSETVTIKTLSANSKIIPIIKDNKPIINIEIKQNGDLQEQTSNENLATLESFAMLEKLEGSIIKDEVISAVNRSKQLKADIFGFGDIIYQHYPKEWNEIEKDWDTVFENITVNVSVDAKLRGSGRISKPLMSNEE